MKKPISNLANVLAAAFYAVWAVVHAHQVWPAVVLGITAVLWGGVLAFATYAERRLARATAELERAERTRAAMLLRDPPKIDLAERGTDPAS